MSEHEFGNGERGPQGDHGQHGDRGDTGLTGATGARGEPGKDWQFTAGSALRLLAYLFVAAACVFSSARTFDLADQSRDALKKIEQEGALRRDQICLSAEREHLNDVTRLVRTYEYLNSLEPEEFETSINRAVLVQLPATEEAAQTDTAPDFCDETLPGGKPVGMPEPDPTIPKRPPGLAAKLKQAQAQAERESAQARKGK